VLVHTGTVWGGAGGLEGCEAGLCCGVRGFGRLKGIVESFGAGCWPEGLFAKGLDV
jgi:hypothetical protein